MSENYRPVKGDRVRVVLEGFVPDAPYNDGSFSVSPSGRHDAARNFITAGAEHVVSVEKIEPPVTVFKPGDVVRRKDNADCVYALGHRQYLAIGAANTHATGFNYDAHGGTEFTSESYELAFTS